MDSGETRNQGLLLEIPPLKVSPLCELKVAGAILPRA
jgi:hypothetical protein